MGQDPFDLIDKIASLADHHDSTNPECRRDYVMRVLHTFLETIENSTDSRASGAHQAILELLLSLQDLDDHGTTAPILSPPFKSNLKGEESVRRYRRGIVVLCIKYLCGKGNTLTDSYALLAQHLGTEGITKKTIKADYSKKNESASNLSPIGDTMPRTDEEYMRLVAQLRLRYLITPPRKK